MVNIFPFPEKLLTFRLLCVRLLMVPDYLVLVGVYLTIGALFNQILPLLMSPTLEEQERHLLVKVIDRIMFKLDDLVRPYAHKILVVIEPMLIDQDYYARVEGTVPLFYSRYRRVLIARS